MSRLIGTFVLFMLALPVQAGPEREIISMVNQLRAKHGIPPVRANALLQSAAMKHARDMAQRQFLSHTGSDGSSVGDRVKRAGYRFCKIAENIAKGQRSQAVVMKDWTASPSHRQNMLTRAATEIGVVRGPQNTWVMVLAARRGRC